MKIADFISPENVIPGLSVADKRECLRVLAQHVEQALGISSSVVFKALIDREALGSTVLE